MFSIGIITNTNHEMDIIRLNVTHYVILASYCLLFTKANKLPRYQIKSRGLAERGQEEEEENEQH